MKSYAVSECPSSRVYEWPDAAANYAAADAAKKTLATNSYYYNGLLHQYPLGEVQEPANVIMLTEALGKVAWRGYLTTFPAPKFADTSTNRDAIYLPKTGNGCATDPVTGQANTSPAFTTTDTLWIHNGGMNFAFADGHVKWRRLGAVINGATDKKSDPWSSYNAQGIPGSRWWDACHYCLFRPKVDPAANGLCKQ